MLDFLSESIPNTHLSYVLRDDCSNVNFVRGPTRLTHEFLRVGIPFLPRMPISPFAQKARRAASICRAAFRLR